MGNIPFAITSQVVSWCIEAPELTSATMVTRLEYAREHSGDHGRWSMQTVRTWPRFHRRLLGTVSHERSRPVPSVDSGVLRLDRRPAGLLPGEALPAYEEFVAIGFGGSGGSLFASLSERYPVGEVAAAFEAAGLETDTLVAFVHPDQWIALFTAIRRG